MGYQEIIVPLKYLSNFWWTFEMPLFNSEVEFTLTWSAIYIVTYTDVADQASTFRITETNIFVPVGTLSTQNNAKLLPQLKPGFERTISWNKYLLKPELSAENITLNQLMEPSFPGANRLFVLAFEDDEQITSNKRWYIPNVEIKDYNVMTDGKIFFDQPVKNNRVT